MDLMRASVCLSAGGASCVVEFSHVRARAGCLSFVRVGVLCTYESRNNVWRPHIAQMCASACLADLSRKIGVRTGRPYAYSKLDYVAISGGWWRETSTVTPHGHAGDGVGLNGCGQAGPERPRTLHQSSGRLIPSRPWAWRPWKSSPWPSSSLYLRPPMTASP